jgi:thioredoxin reductase
MIDELPPIEGFRELWSRAIFQCPYCHGWEIQDRRWAYLGRAAEAGHLLPFTLMLRGWTNDVVAFTGGEFEVPEDARATLSTAGIRLETAPVARLVARGHALTGIELSDGTRVACDALFTHPPQRHGDLTTRMQAAIHAAAAGTHAASMINVELSAELAVAGASS